MALRCPKKPPRGPKRPPRGPKRPPRGPKEAPERHQKDTKRPENGPPKGFKTGAQKPARGVPRYPNEQSRGFPATARARWRDGPNAPGGSESSTDPEGTPWEAPKGPRTHPTKSSSQKAFRRTKVSDNQGVTAAPALARNMCSFTLEGTWGVPAAWRWLVELILCHPDTILPPGPGNGRRSRGPPSTSLS